MPLYLFINSITGEIRDVFFKMNDVKEYFGEPDDQEYVDDLGNDIEVFWKRVYVNPNMAMDTKIDPFSSKDFLKKTENAKNYGQLWDLSAEMSRQRADKLGHEDPQRKKAEENFYKPKKKQ